MVRLPIFFLPMVFFGITSGTCPSGACHECKEITDPLANVDGILVKGIWNIKLNLNGECPTSCLYQRNSDAMLMCFCDPGDIDYYPCPEWKDAQCFEDTAGIMYPYPFMVTLPLNSPAACRGVCQYENDNNGSTYTYFALEDDKCFCGNKEPPTSLHPKADPQSLCDMPCTGNPSVMCGGTGYANVYAVRV